MISLESSSPPESMALLSYSSLSLLSVLLLSALALLSFCVNVLAFLSVGRPALGGLFCCKHECLTIIAFTFSLLLIFKCCFSPWSFKYLFSSGTRIFLSFVTSSVGWPPNNKSKNSHERTNKRRWTFECGYSLSSLRWQPISYHIVKSTIYSIVRENCSSIWETLHSTCLSASKTMTDCKESMPSIPRLMEFSACRTNERLVENMWPQNAL